VESEKRGLTAGAAGGAAWLNINYRELSLLRRRDTTEHRLSDNRRGALSWSP